MEIRCRFNAHFSWDNTHIIFRLKMKLIIRDNAEDVTGKKFNNNKKWTIHLFDSYSIFPLQMKENNYNISGFLIPNICFLAGFSFQ